MIDNFFHTIPKWYIVFFKWFFPAIGGLSLIALKAYWTSAKIFREKVHAALIGVYPSIELYITPNEINTKIRQSIPKIQTAVNNFKHFLPFFFRRRLEIAAENYYKTARETDWYQCLKFYMPNPIIHPKEKFKKAVDELLKYAK
jgi:hypothetical protein